MVSHTLLTTIYVILAVGFFCVPLYLKHHVYRAKNNHLVAGDVTKVHGRLSSTWCQGVNLRSDTKFKAFVYYSDPEVDPRELQRTVSTHRILLPNREQEYWGFYLLKGSKVEVSACARLTTADVTIIKGHSGLKECLLEHNVNHRRRDSSNENSLSESESDEDTSSISSSQGVIANETDTPYVCSNALQHAVIPTSYTCMHPFDKVNRTYIFSQDIEDTDHYYYVFSSATIIDVLPNEFNVQFAIDRTHYNYSASSDNCTAGKNCLLDIDMGSEPRIVVQMDNVNGTLEDLKLVMGCKPREGLFLIFYALFFLVVFMCSFQ